MADLSEIFGSGKLSYDEFLIKAGEMGSEIGDIGELRQSYENELKSVKRNAALERELDRAGVKNRALITKVIDMDSVSVDEDGVHGIAEQLTSLRESDPYLFEDERQHSQSAPHIRTGMTHRSEPLDSDSLSDADFYRQIKKM